MRDRKRPPASGSVILTGPASRSTIADEYKVSRFRRITVWLSSEATSRRWLNLARPPDSLTRSAKYLSVSARTKLSTVTGTGFDGLVCASEAAPRNPHAMSIHLFMGGGFLDDLLQSLNAIGSSAATG